MKRTTKLLLAGLIMTILVAHFYTVFGFQYDTSYEVNAGECRRISTNIIGPKDQAFVNADSIITSSSDLTNIMIGKPEDRKKGGFWVMTNKGGDGALSEVEVRNFPKGVELNPTGIDLQQKLLVAVNHPMKSGNGDRIEIFDYDAENRVATHRRSVSFTGDHVVRLADVTIYSAERFFVAVAMPFSEHMEGRAKSSPLKNFLEFVYLANRVSLLGIYDCQISNYESKEAVYKDVCRKIPGLRVRSSNGVAYVRKLNKLFVADLSEKKIMVYRFLKDSLEYERTIVPECYPEHLILDKSANVMYVTGHARVFDLYRSFIEVGLSKDHMVQSKFSNIVEAIDLSDEELKPKKILQGKFMGSATSGFKLGGHVFLGGVYDTFFSCKV